jgi:carbonic anhydrase
MKNTLPSNLSPLKNFRHDLPAGLVVFLVALPLCLGIALASGAPLISGIIAGIVGGLVVGFVSNSSLGVSGPAAGLTVLVFNGIEELGIATFLLAVVVAGLVQIVLSFARAGIIAYYFPSTVISGMLFGIGVIIILKQIPHAFGYDKDYEGDMDFVQSDGYNTLSEISHVIDSLSPTAIAITSIAIVIMLLWQSKWFKATTLGKLIPGSLAAVLSGSIINQLLLIYLPEWALSSSHLVTIPDSGNRLELFNHIVFPDFSQFMNPAIYSTGFIIAIVASLETLLCTEATDKLDPHKRSTNTNRELFAQGIGNTVSGCLGGLPVTQVIVRSSANVQANGQTKASAMFHGFLLLAAVLSIPNLLNMIPLATLAAILLFVGYKLAHPKTLKSMYSTGVFHFIPFIATAAGLVFTDLLTGVAIGTGIAIFSILLENFRMGVYFDSTQKGNATILNLAEHVSFLNKANLLQVLHRQPPNTELIINAMNAKFIDYDVREIISNFAIEAKDRNIDFKFIDMKSVRPNRSKMIQDNMTPAEALDILKQGNKRFMNNLHSHHDLLAQVNITSAGQHPFAIILSCIDSRISSELVFDQGLGDIFSVRIAGNIINSDILGSMEYACGVTGSKLIVVLGHTQCGAVRGACCGVELENLNGLLNKIKPSVDHVRQNHPGLDKDSLVNRVSKHNVSRTIDQILAQSNTLKQLYQEQKIDIVGGMYDINSGEVEFCKDKLCH